MCCLCPLYNSTLANSSFKLSINCLNFPDILLTDAHAQNEIPCCMSDCNSERQPSLYEQHCCNLSNIGNIFEFKDGKVHTEIICPSNLLTSCSSCTILLAYKYINFILVLLHQDISISYWLMELYYPCTYSLNYNKVCNTSPLSIAHHN